MFDASLLGACVPFGHQHAARRGMEGKTNLFKKSKKTKK